MNSLTINSNILYLKNIAMSSKYNFETRKDAIYQIIKFPHKDIFKHTLDCVCNIMSDDSYDINQRYLFFNNPKYFSNILNDCHLFYFHNFHYPRYPKHLKINSAKYILINIPSITYDLREIQNFMWNISNDNTIDLHIKTECKNILLLSGYKKDTRNEINNIPTTNITNITNIDITSKLNKVSETRKRILTQRKTIYEDGQNVHTTSINESVHENLKNIYNEYNNNLNNKLLFLNEISKRITELSKSFNLIKKQKIIGSFDRILIDTINFNNNNLHRTDLILSDILVLVWCKINSKPNIINELEQRLIEELIEMNGLCSSGHLSRLINILCGFFDDIKLTIDYKDQIKSYIFNFMNKLLLKDEKLTEIIVNEIIEEGIDKKTNLLKLIDSSDLKNILKKEFSDLEEFKFNDYYNNAIKIYCGL